MLQFPKTTQYSSFTKEIQQIKILSQTLKNFPIQDFQLKNIFHQQLFKSSLFSAKIEGNTLTLANTRNINLNNPKQKKEQEVSNIAKAHHSLDQLKKIELTKLKQLHQIILKNLPGNSGKIRNEVSAIFDQTGAAVYITPDRETVDQMLQILFSKLNSIPDTLTAQLHLAINCHYYYEKIHPFVDGNGRLGRILLHWQLKKFYFLGDNILPIEEYFNKHRQVYYLHLEKNSTNTKDFFKFFLDGIIWSLQKQLEEIKSLAQKNPQEKQLQSLLPRRQEIIHILHDHHYCSLDFIARRFPTMARRTIQYDLQKLVEKGLVIKHGQTRGVVYRVKNAKLIFCT